MWLFYLIVAIYNIFGAFFCFFSKKIQIIEFVIVCISGFILALIFNLVAIHGMTDDIETWSGYVEHAIFYPQWVEKYEEMIYKTVIKTGNKGETYTEQVFSHFETRYRTHHEYWSVFISIDGEINVKHSVYSDITEKFGNSIEKKWEHKGGFHSGDHNIYISNNKTGYIYPTVSLRHWTNKIKAAPSVFSFIKIPEEISVFEYPENNNIFSSNRLIGTSSQSIDQYDFDAMNSRLNIYPFPYKKVNVIMVGFESEDSILGQYQEAKWIGGRKNDLVICYGGKDPKNPTWSYVFGWTEQEIVKRNIESIILENSLDSTILPIIESEIIKNYEIKDWSKFDYITIEVSKIYYFIFILFLIVIQGILYFKFHNN